MRFTELEIAGAYLIDIERHEDERGFFARTFCAGEFAERRLVTTIAQCSTSFNSRKGTLRGLHYQVAPHEEAKVVRCTAGAIFDVVVDLRTQSPTYGSWRGAKLSAANHRMMYVPAGIAHGFQTIVDDSEVFYQISVDYAPASARGLLWNDPKLGIEWPLPDSAIVSARDAAFPVFPG